MFTGIVEELGTVTQVRDQRDALRLTVAAEAVLDGTRRGDSIAVNGCCLTVAAQDSGGFSADLMRETLDQTVALAPGDPVNLERAVRADGRLGGHLVQGHVDGVGTVLDRTTSAHWEMLAVSVPATLAHYLVPKGSIAVDGVSLTVVEAGPDRFTVGLIPETLARTTLGRRRPGDRVNLEVDILAKYVARYVARLTATVPTTKEAQR